MTVMNSGTVYANKTFTPEAFQLLETNRRFDKDLLKYMDGNWLDVDEWYEVSFEDELTVMIETLAPLGYVFHGQISYYGDYDGQIIVKDNRVQSVDIEDVGLYTADDSRLIQMLKERGYTILRDGIEV